MLDHHVLDQHGAVPRVAVRHGVDRRVVLRVDHRHQHRRHVLHQFGKILRAQVRHVRAVRNANIPVNITQVLSVRPVAPLLLRL